MMRPEAYGLLAAVLGVSRHPRGSGRTQEKMVEEKKHNARWQKRIARVAEFLREQSTLVLATTTEPELPRATPLFYVPGDGLDLYWLSSTRSRHSVNVAERAQASVAVFAPTFAWREIVGVQMVGSVATIHGDERKPLLKQYSERFHLGTIFSIAMQQSTLYRFRPHWLRYTDNRKRFGYRFEIDL